MYRISYESHHVLSIFACKWRDSWLHEVDRDCLVSYSKLVIMRQLTHRDQAKIKVKYYCWLPDSSLDDRARTWRG